MKSAPNTLPTEPANRVTGGIDWARDDHAVSVVDHLGREIVRATIEHNATGLRELLTAARTAGAREAVWNVLFLRGSARGFFLDFVRREMPWLSARYEALYAQGTRVQAEYRETVERRVERLAREVGLGGLTREDRIRREAGPAPPRQLELVW